MSKRRAGNELTRDNWDYEEEKVEPGIFQLADHSILKNRVVKKAKRMLQRDETGEIKPIFSGFAGFNSIVSNSNSKQAFSFLTKNHNETPSESGNHPSASTINSLTTSSSLQTSDNNCSKSSGPTIIDSIKVMKLNEAFVKFITNAVQKNPYCVLTPTLKDYEKQISKFVSLSNCKTNITDSLMASSKESPQVSSYENMVTNIKDSDEVKNNSVKVQKTSSDFIKPISNTSNGLLFNFSKDSPVSDITKSKNSTFELNKTDEEIKKDSKTETKEKNPESVIESKFSSTASSGFKLPDVKFNQQSFSTTLTKNSSDKFAFNDSKTSPLNKFPEFKLNTTPSFNFGASGSSFSFNKPLPQQTDSKPFFSFGSIPDQSKISETEKLKNEEDDEDQPPVVNFTPVKENDAIFESKSKLYCLKNGKYEEHGIGQLYIKPVDNKKVQLIMRNDSALGTIMVNTLLNDTVNFTKRNPKNVQLICVLDPTKCVKPQTVLFKFKDSQITDAFESELAKLKK
ncbi:Ran binding domain,PH domain-like,Nuclear pore complex, NUP2/50/61 [Cinara cedri]|uniref:Ran binding domain,PH domain-like,Nuclear pore complex, NUP2/50/61 n=1 Tax=Cinara cedri TaxID=506608 RepID=A0A5E4MTU2_9HEMI|nr:Ran binding domain,PH domain-like,Nuclear pore complex, NUP2/50/61 [Cinara cedri]